MNIHYVEKWMSIMLRQIPREASLILFPPSAVTSFSAKFYGCQTSDLILRQKIETEHIKSPLFWELNLFRQFRRSSVFVWQRLVIKNGWWLRVQTWQMLLPKGSWNVRRTIDTVWASPPTWLLNMSGHQAAQSGLGVGTTSFGIDGGLEQKTKEVELDLKSWNVSKAPRSTDPCPQFRLEREVT